MRYDLVLPNPLLSLTLSGIGWMLWAVGETWDFETGFPSVSTPTLKKRNFLFTYITKIRRMTASAETAARKAVASTGTAKN